MGFGPLVIPLSKDQAHQFQKVFIRHNDFIDGKDISQRTPEEFRVEPAMKSGNDYLKGGDAFKFISSNFKRILNINNNQFLNLLKNTGNVSKNYKIPPIIDQEKNHYPLSFTDMDHSSNYELMKAQAKYLALAPFSLIEMLFKHNSSIIYDFSDNTKQEIENILKKNGIFLFATDKLNNQEIQNNFNKALLTPPPTVIIIKR